MFAAQADIARRFSQAAAGYDQAATIQRLTRAHLYAFNDCAAHGQIVADIGSGSGGARRQAGCSQHDRQSDREAAEPPCLRLAHVILQGHDSMISEALSFAFEVAACSTGPSNERLLSSMLCIQAMYVSG